MKGFFTEWWAIQREEKAMEKAYMKKHWKGVVLLNVALSAIPVAGLAISAKFNNKKKPNEQVSKIEES